MVMGAFLGKKYPLRKFITVGFIIAGVAYFVLSGSGVGKPDGESDSQVGLQRRNSCGRTQATLWGHTSCGISLSLFDTRLSPVPSRHPTIALRLVHSEAFRLK